MRRNSLRELLRSLVVVAAPLASNLSGCPCGPGPPDEPENYYPAPPDGGWPQAALGQLLPEKQCAAVCGWGDWAVGGDGGDFAFRDSPLYFDSAKPHQCRFVASDGGSPVLFCQNYAHSAIGWCSGGRRPAGLHDPAPPAEGVLETGAFLARMAHLEAASVPAFVRLARELGAHGAPARLVAWARRAARDEVRHARAVGALARRHGASPPAVTLDAPAARTLAAIARENLVEGCIGETWGALLAFHQAEHAADEAIRRALEAIAADEADHAELALAVADWIHDRLDDDGRAGLDAARAHGLRDLRASLAAPLPPRLRHDAGLPSPEVALRLFDAAYARLWSKPSSAAQFSSIT